MEKSVKIWFPTYVGDFFTSTASMTGHEVGAYVTIIAKLWRDGGSISADDKQLAKLAKATPRQWKEIKETLWPFFEIKGGLLTHPETTAEIEKAKENQKKKRAAGIASGKSRRSTSAEQVFNETPTNDEHRAGSGEGEGPIHDTHTIVDKSDGPFSVLNGGKL